VPAPRRSAKTMERDHKAYDLFRRGLSYRQIAAELGVSHQTAFDAVRRAAKDNAASPLEQAAGRQAALDRLQDYRRAAQKVLMGRHYQVSQAGKTVAGPDGKPLIDPDPSLRALGQLKWIEQEDNRLHDLYPPSRARIEVVDDDVARALVDQMEAEIASLSADPGRSLA
jgi:transposase-like protein